MQYSITMCDASSPSSSTLSKKHRNCTPDVEFCKLSWCLPPVWVYRAGFIFFTYGGTPWLIPRPCYSHHLLYLGSPTQSIQFREYPWEALTGFHELPGILGLFRALVLPTVTGRVFRRERIVRSPVSIITVTLFSYMLTPLLLLTIAFPTWTDTRILLIRLYGRCSRMERCT